MKHVSQLRVPLGHLHANGRHEFDSPQYRFSVLFCIIFALVSVGEIFTQGKLLLVISITYMHLSTNVIPVMNMLNHVPQP